MPYHGVASHSHSGRKKHVFTSIKTSYQTTWCGTLYTEGVIFTAVRTSNPSYTACHPRQSASKSPLWEHKFSVQINRGARRHVPQDSTSQSVLWNIKFHVHYGARENRDLHDGPQQNALHVWIIWQWFPLIPSKEVTCLLQYFEAKFSFSTVQLGHMQAYRYTDFCYVSLASLAYWIYMHSTNSFRADF